MDRSEQAATSTRVEGPTVVLKKYGNRRLYDTTASRYVTLVEVEAMVQRGVDIQVVDAKSGDDITKEVLVQLLLERDSARASLPTALLKQAVRLANSPLKEGLVKAMQDGLDTFMSSQRAVADAQRALTSQLTPWLQPTTTPVPMWNPFPAPQSLGTPVQQTQQQQQTTTTTHPSDVDQLRAELGQTQALVRQLLERELARSDVEDAAAKKTTKKKKATPKRA